MRAGDRVKAGSSRARPAREAIHPLRDLHVTILHLMGLDDAGLTCFHGGSFKQLSQTSGQVIPEPLA